MSQSIGAGTRIYMGDAAAPMNTANGGASSDADLDDVTDFFTAFNFSEALATVDVTTLSVDDNDYARSFIAGLLNPSVSGTYIEQSAACALGLRLDGIKKGSNHVKGRGCVDFRVKVGGASAGNLQIDGTIIVTESGLDIAIEAALGHPFSGQVTDGLTLAAQS